MPELSQLSRDTTGERNHLQIKVTMPDGTIYDSSKPFWANVYEFNDELILADIWVNQPDRWGHEDTVVELPFQLRIAEETPDGDRHLSLVCPEPDDIGANIHFADLGDYILGRKAGSSNFVQFSGVTTNLTVTVEPTVEMPEGVVVTGPVTRIVNVLPNESKINLTAEDGPEDELTLENRMIGDNLVGTFAMTVSTEDEDLYSSATTDAILEGECEPGKLVINGIWIEDEYGDTHRLPFGLELTLPNTNVAQFTIEHVTQGQVAEGEFTFWGKPENMIKAVSDGESHLDAKIIYPVTEDQLPIVFGLGSDSSTRLSVSVPPPLEPKLIQWKNDGRVINFDQGDPWEVIYSSGFLVGEIKNHREEGTAEKICIEISPDQNDINEFYLRCPDEEPDLAAMPEGSCEFSKQFEDRQVGGNSFTLTVWKPIHTVLGIGKQSITREIKGVKPEVQIDWACHQKEIDKNPTEPVSIRYQWCYGVYVQVFSPTGSVDTVLEDDDGSYGVTTISDIDLQLAAYNDEFGNHTVRLSAINDFAPDDDPVSDEVWVTAVEPKISANFVKVNGNSHEDGDTLIVSHDREYRNVELKGSISRSQAYVIHLNGNSIVHEQYGAIEGLCCNGVDGEQSFNHDINDLLEVGVNTITVQAVNYFGVVSKEAKIKRRDLVYYVISALETWARNGSDQSQQVAIDFYDNGEFLGTAGPASMVQVYWPPQGEYQYSQSDPPISYYRCLCWDSDNGQYNSCNFDVYASIDGIAEDENLQSCTLALKIPASIVVGGVNEVHVPNPEAGYVYTRSATMNNPTGIMTYWIMVRG